MIRWLTAPVLVLAFLPLRSAAAGPTTRPDNPIYLPKMDPKLQDWYDQLHKKLAERSAFARAASTRFQSPSGGSEIILPDGLVIPPGTRIILSSPADVPREYRELQPSWGLFSHSELEPYGPSFMFNGLRVYMEPVAFSVTVAPRPATRK